jgi:glucose-6-phosphate-specific signal transduction histidine kinase
MENVGIFYGHLVSFKAIWYILWSFGIYFPVLVCCSKKNLTTLIFSLGIRRSVPVQVSRVYIQICRYTNTYMYILSNSNLAQQKDGFYVQCRSVMYAVCKNSRDFRNLQSSDLFFEQGWRFLPYLWVFWDNRVL